MINGISPEYISQGVLGTVFHELIPLEVRKPVAAYYTLEKAGEILASLTIQKDSDLLMDPACGSGTLLAAGYEEKKRRLAEPMSELIRQRFVERDITGVDIMAFVAHLSTIHLALEGPIYKTDKVRIVIRDSTDLKPGDKIPSISISLPRARAQRRIEEYESGRPEIEKETLQAGVVSTTGKITLGELKVNKVDVVLMNPPFTRFQRLSTFEANYTQDLQRRFVRYAEFINSKMPYSTYFFFLADKFLNEGGRLGAVLPATMLRGDSTVGFRKYLLSNYEVEFIIIREDRMNFSEDTDFREILVAKKGASTSSINYVILRDLDSADGAQFVRGSLTSKVGSVNDFGSFEIRKKQSPLRMSRISSDQSVRRIASSLRFSTRFYQTRFS